MLARLNVGATSSIWVFFSILDISYKVYCEARAVEAKRAPRFIGGLSPREQPSFQLLYIMAVKIEAS